MTNEKKWKMSREAMAAGLSMFIGIIFFAGYRYDHLNKGIWFMVIYVALLIAICFSYFWEEMVVQIKKKE